MDSSIAAPSFAFVIRIKQPAVEKSPFPGGTDPALVRPKVRFGVSGGVVSGGRLNHETHERTRKTRKPFVCFAFFRALRVSKRARELR